MDNSKRVFFELLRAGLFPVHGEWGMVHDYSNVDWQEVYRLATEQSVLGLVLAGLERFNNLNANHLETIGTSDQGRANVNIPQVLLLQMIGEVQLIEQRNKAMNAFIASLVKKMREADIYTLLVKGQGVALCYEKPLWRACGDVDFFLSDDNYNKAKALLVPLATEVETEYEGVNHLGMSIDGWVVELHGSLRVGLPRRINRVLDDIQVDTFNNGDVRSWLNGQTQVFMLGKENDIVYVFVHFFNHFYKEGVGLRQICDWCRLMWTYRNEIDVKKIEGLVKRMGLVTEWRAFYNLASRYLGMPDLDSDLMAYDSRFDKKADRIIEFVLKSGNMGHNREMSHFSNKPYLIRKFVSMGRRISDLINHVRIFPVNSLRFFPRIMWNGVRSAVRGE